MFAHLWPTEILTDTIIREPNRLPLTDCLFWSLLPLSHFAESVIELKLN
jgi:hypothetical protein